VAKTPGLSPGKKSGVDTNSKIALAACKSRCALLDLRADISNSFMLGSKAGKVQLFS
jgi:hypothetical protein